MRLGRIPGTAPSVERPRSQDLGLSLFGIRFSQDFRGCVRFRRARRDIKLRLSTSAAKAIAV
jgi:hypothetical protein